MAPAGENPLALGTILDSNVSSAAISATQHRLVELRHRRSVRVHAAAHLSGAAGKRDVLGRRGRHQERVSAAAAARLLDAAHRHHIGWSSYGNGIRVNDNTASVFDYLDPQWQWVMNAGWNKGVHNVKFGVDVHRLHMNHYEITAPSFNFTGRRTALSATGSGAESVQRLCRFSAGPSDLTEHRAAESAARRGQRQQRAVGHAADVGIRHLHPRSVSVDAQADGLGGRALGVLPGSAARRSRRRDLRLHAQPAAAVRARGRARRLRHQGAEGSLHAAARRRVPGRPIRWSSAPATRAIRRTTT